MALEKTGVQLVAENANRAIKDVQRFDQAVGKLDKTTGHVDRAGKAFGKLDDVLGKIGKSASSFGSKFSSIGTQFKSFLSNLTNVIPGAGKLMHALNQAEGVLGSFSIALSSLASPAGIAAAAIVGVTVALAGIVTLGQRGARIQQTAQAFGNMASGAGDATEVLNGMRRATRGTINDVELMTLSTLALAGAQPELRREFLAVSDGSTALGRVFDNTRRIANATGVSAEIVREKFVRGLRVQRAALLDDVGVTVDAAQAQELYAAAIGKTVTELTDAEKKAAFAREAIRQLDEITASLGERQSALDNFARPMVVLQNIIDKLSLAALPVFEPIAAAIASVANAVESVANVFFPIIGRLGELLGNLISVSLLPLKIAFAAIGFVLRPLVPIFYLHVAAITLLIDAINWLLAPLVNIGSAFSSVGSSASSATNGIRNAVAGIGGAISSLAGSAVGLGKSLIGTFSGIAKSVAGILPSIAAMLQTVMMQMVMMAGQGGGAITGAFAAGLIRGGEQVVRAVTAIAQIVADFLQGFSPPKVGPLSRIDEGGFNVARAWAEGFQKGFVRPVQIVQDEITSKLGEISTLVADDLETRLRNLDIAILPFNEQLALAKARVEEIAGFVDPALRSIERQRKAALSAFAEGKADAEAVRALDRQVDRLRAIKEQGEALSDQAEIELAFAKSSQAVERAKLDIQKKRLEMFAKEETAAEAVEKAVMASGGGGAGAAAAKEAEKKAASAKKEAKKKPAGGAGGGEPFGEEGGGGLQAGEAPNLLEHGGVTAAREGIINFAQGAANIAGDAFGALGNVASLETAVGFAEGLHGAAGDVAGALVDVGGQFGQGFAQGFSESGFDQATADFSLSTGELQTQLGRIADSNPVQSLTEKFTGFADILTEPLSTMAETVANTFGPDGSIATAVSGLFGEEGLFGPAGIIGTAFTNLFGPESTLALALGPEGTLLPIITGFVESATAAFTELQSTVETTMRALPSAVSGPLSRVRSAFNGAFNSAVSPVRLAVANVASMIADMIAAISNFATGGLLEALRPLPGNLWDAMLSPFVAAINGIIQTVQNAINGALSALPGFLRDQIGLSNVNLGSVDLPERPASFNARGGIGRTGLAVVGEEGPELLRLQRPTNILPTDPTRALMEFLGAGSSPMLSGGVSNTAITNNNQRNITANFNNASPQQTLLYLRELEAL